MQRPIRLTVVLGISVLLALVTLTTRACVVQAALLSGAGLPAIGVGGIAGAEGLVVGAALLVVALLAFRPDAAAHRALTWLYAIGIVVALIWGLLSILGLAGGLFIWWRVAVERPEGGYGDGFNDFFPPLASAVAFTRVLWVSAKVGVFGYGIWLLRRDAATRRWASGRDSGDGSPARR